ncbi:heterokaryon incompatibility protein-domain-containing protein, partial [Lophiotrema nucula]
MIRLLRLKSRAHSPYITCEILHCNIENDYDYIALSYAWGPEGENECILVDGCLCTISAHLTGALQHLQKDDEDCLYWIDQLCINQADDEEKSDQVYRMGSIYERAQCVVVWLGKPDDDSDLLMVFFGIL